VAWLTFRSLGWRGRNLAGAALALSAVALWTEPVQRALQLGQVELVLMALIVWDLGQPDRRWWKGAGIGLAAGIKLVPLIFLPYLLLTGRLRQAAAAAAAFAVTVLIGFAVLPAASVKWWLTGYFFHPGKVGAVGALVNQSLLSSITRLAGTVAAATPVWLGVSAVTGAAGLAAAAALYRARRPAAGWLACALTGLLISPVSWDHHWVWIVPVLALITDAAIRASRRARWCYGALAAVLAVVFGAWPGQWSGRAAFATHGLLGFFPAAAEIGNAHLNSVYRLHGVQVLSWNLFVLAGLVMLAMLVAAAWRSRTAGQADRGGARGAPAHGLAAPGPSAEGPAADGGAAERGAADGRAPDGRAAGAAAP
jgi:alpha-1,2-mannosyltransferase